MLNGAEMADTWTTLSPAQWAARSWCAWASRVQDTAGHILAAAEQTPPHFYQELISAGLRFDVFTDRGARRLAVIGPDRWSATCGAQTATTNHPPAPVMAMLGEIVVQSKDIRRAAGPQAPAAGGRPDRGRR